MALSIRRGCGVDDLYRLWRLKFVLAVMPTICICCDVDSSYWQWREEFILAKTDDASLTVNINANVNTTSNLMHQHKLIVDLNLSNTDQIASTTMEMAPTGVRDDGRRWR